MTVPYRNVQYRYFPKIPLHLNVTLFYPPQHATLHSKNNNSVTSIATLNCNGKDHRYTYRYKTYFFEQRLSGEIVPKMMLLLNSRKSQWDMDQSKFIFFSKVAKAGSYNALNALNEKKYSEIL